MKKYEFIDHTADVGVKAYGKTLSECFEHAAVSMFDIITDSSRIESKGEYIINIESDDLEQLLVDWLSELLFLQSSRNIVFGEFHVNIDQNKSSLSSTVFGEEFDTSKHKSGVEIKAVTYHMLAISQHEPYYVQVLFDI
jgi:SHS2 domain-containing protein